MLRSWKKLRKNQEGATAIEFAVLSPVLFMLIFGIIELGIIFTTQAALEGAASQASRTYKAQARSNNQGASVAQIRRMITDYGAGLVRPGNMRVVAQDLGGWGGASMPGNAGSDRGRSGSTSQIVQYRIYYDFKISTPLLKNVLGTNGNLTLRAATVVQNEPSIGGGSGA